MKKLLSLIGIVLLVLVTITALDSFVSSVRERPMKHSSQATALAKTPIKIQAVLAAEVNANKYTELPYNLLPPNGASDIEYSDKAMQNLNAIGNIIGAHQDYLQTIYEAKLVDPFLTVIWTGAIEGTQGDPYSWNCMDGDNSINDGCEGGYYSGGWQVGYGIQVVQAEDHIEADFNAVYGGGSADDTEKVHSIGQAVIDNSANLPEGKITNPENFPSETIATLVRHARGGSMDAQQAIAILLMDPQLGAVVAASEVAGDISSGENWRAVMQGWGPYYGDSNQQLFSNRMAAIAEKYTGQGSTSSNGGGFGSIGTLTLRVRPKTEDSWVINQAFAQVVGAKAGSGTISTGSGRPGRPLPSQDVTQIKQILCQDYKVCPTMITLTEQQPSGDWTLPQLTALWNVVQRIYESDTYKALAIGNYTMEFARGKCYTTGCDSTLGYYTGQTRRDYATIPDSRLIVITDNVTNTTDPIALEWLFAHEIGHSASGGRLDGALDSSLGYTNEAYQKVLACKEIVSEYGKTRYNEGEEYVAPGNENNSEILAFYMTAAEEVKQGYLGANKNLKTDFPCTYNAVKDYYFDGVEF